jgi:hypothetical protein
MVRQAKSACSVCLSAARQIALGPLNIGVLDVYVPVEKIREKCRKIADDAPVGRMGGGAADDLGCD